jgi:pimeloyl-ACP methyl ester carboxylesterase
MDTVSTESIRGEEMLTKFIADSMTKPGKAPVFGNPKDFGLEYEDVTFQASDEVTLSGWLVKGGADKVIIQTHFGIQCSRSGYTPKGKGLIRMWPKDIEFLKHVKHLVGAGYSVLMYDLRNHGNSGKGACEWVAGGPEEYKDVIAAVDFITNHPDYTKSEIGLLSICMGANSTTYAYGNAGGLREYENIKALVAIQPIGFMEFLRAMGVPRSLVARANRLNLKRGGLDFNSTCLPQVKSINVPTMLVQNQNDPWTNMDWVKQYYDNLTVEKEMFWIEGEKKRLAAYAYFGQNPEKMLEFFNKHLRSA